MNTVIYLYGFVPVNAPSPPAGIGGIGASPVDLLDLGRISAAVSHLPAQEFAAEKVEPLLEDIAWVGEQGIAHERVVVWFADNSEILPARMFSIYSGEAALRAAATPDIERLAERLRSLGAMREWNLKVGYDADALALHGAEISTDIQRIDAETDAATPGRRYLLERKRADLLKDALRHAARRLADELLQSLSAHAAAVLMLPSTTDDESGLVVLNAALLVGRDAEPQLRAAAAALHTRYSQLGMVVSFSGPWAPYRFVDRNDDA